jgi:hypothetical protein
MYRADRAILTKLLELRVRVSRNALDATVEFVKLFVSVVGDSLGVLLLLPEPRLRHPVGPLSLLHTAWCGGHAANVVTTDR